MASAGTSAIRIIDSDNEVVSVTSNRLDVNAYLNATPTIDIGDVSLLLGGTAADTGLGTYGAQTLRVTLAADDALTLLMVNDLDTIAANLHFKAPSNSYSAGGTPSGIISMAFRQDTLGDYFSGLGINDEDWTYLQVNSKGGLYVTGSEVENSAVQSEPLLIGGRFDSSARTLGDGDAGAVALNASGHMIMDVVDGGQLDTIIDTLETTLTAIETDQAAIEALLITIDSDTDAIKTAVQILDDWDDSNYANVNLNIAGTDVDGNSGNKSAQSQRVVIATDDVNVSAIKTAVELLDDVVYTDDSTEFTLGSSKGVMMMGFAGAQSVSADDVAALRCTTTGVLYTKVESVSYGNPLSFYQQEADTYDGANIGPAVKAVRNDTLAALTSVDDGDSTSLQVDAEGALYTTHGMTGMVSGKNTGVDDTTAEVIVAAAACKRIDMQASPSNTGDIWVGGSNVAVNQGIKLAPGDFYSIDIDNTDDVYVLATVDEEDIAYTYYT